MEERAEVLERWPRRVGSCVAPPQQQPDEEPGAKLRLLSLVRRPPQHLRDAVVLHVPLLLWLLPLIPPGHLARDHPGRRAPPQHFPPAVAAPLGPPMAHRGHVLPGQARVHAPWLPRRPLPAHVPRVARQPRWFVVLARVHFGVPPAVTIGLFARVPPGLLFLVRCHRRLRQLFSRWVFAGRPRPLPPLALLVWWPPLPPASPS